jgi:hypothetical protein
MQWGDFLDLTKLVLLRSLNERLEKQGKKPVERLQPLKLYPRDEIIEYADSDDEAPKKQPEPDLSHIPDILAPLLDRNCQSMSCELCGRHEPHLVAYDFDIDLKPLFKTMNNGDIEPILIGRSQEEKVVLHDIVPSENLILLCKRAQQQDFHGNEEFRQKHHLQHRYEYDHFENEGWVLYLLDKNMKVINRTMYKIKPRDIEEVHWGSFDEFKKGLVLEALRKMKEREKPMNVDSLIEELDMGPKEFGKYEVS